MTHLQIMSPKLLTFCCPLHPFAKQLALAKRHRICECICEFVIVLGRALCHKEHATMPKNSVQQPSEFPRHKP